MNVSDGALMVNLSICHLRELLAQFDKKKKKNCSICYTLVYMCPITWLDSIVKKNSN